MLFNLFLQGSLPERFAILAPESPRWGTTLTARRWRRPAGNGWGRAFTAEGWQAFAPSLHYLGGGFDRQGTFEAIRDRIAGLRPVCGEQAWCTTSPCRLT